MSPSKSSRPNGMTELRSISLCLILYEIISKILIYRLKTFLHGIVLESKSAFVEERLITDNILIAHEIIPNLSTNVNLYGEFMAIMTYMSKSYDRVKLGYVKALMKSMRFPPDKILE